MAMMVRHERRLGVVALLLLLVVVVPTVRGFSAHLSRPWGPIRKRNRLRRTSGTTTTTTTIILGRNRYVSTRSETFQNAVDDDNDGLGDHGDSTSEEKQQTVGKRERNNLDSVSSSDTNDPSSDDFVVIDPKELKKMAFDSEGRIAIPPTTTPAAVANDGHNNDNQNHHKTDGTAQLRLATTTVLNRVRPFSRQLFDLMGVMLLHCVGTKLAIDCIPNVAFTARLLLATLIQPSMLVVLMTLLLLWSRLLHNPTGPVHEKPNGRSITDPPNGSRHTEEQLPNDPLQVANASTLFLAAMIPGIPARLSVISSVVLIARYGKQVNDPAAPRWVAHAIHAALVGFIPLISVAAATQLVSGQQWRMLPVPRLWLLVFTLFFGVLSREALLDCRNTGAKRPTNMPSFYGRRMGALQAFASLTLMTVFALVGKSSIRQLVFAGLGCGAVVYRGLQVLRTGADDDTIISRAISESKTMLAFLVTSFV